jgi:valyl-tRNA synthetase
LIVSAWPVPALRDDASEAEIDWLVRLISEIRGVRAEMNVPPSARLALLVKGASASSAARLAVYAPIIHTLARIERIELAGDGGGKGAVQIVVDEATIFLPLADIVDLAAERARLVKEIAKVSGEIDKLDAKLGNDSFIARAPAEIVEEQREKRVEAAALRQKLEDAVGRIGAVAR